MEIDNEPSVQHTDVELRPIFCKLNAQTRSDGSAILTQGV